MNLPPAYQRFLTQLARQPAHVSGGTYLYRTDEERSERRTTLEIEEYLPDYLPIGNDGGGQEVLLRIDGNDPRVFLVGHGLMDEESVLVVAQDLESFWRSGCVISVDPEVIDSTHPDYTRRAREQLLHHKLAALQQARERGEITPKAYLLGKRELSAALVAAKKDR